MRLPDPQRQQVTPQQQIARIAAAQDGVIVAAQLRAAGVSAKTMSRWARVGHLHRLHRGVYAVGHPALSERGVRRAALLAVSDRSSLCLWTGAQQLGLVRSGPATVHVAVADGRHATVRPGIAVHHMRSMIEQDVALVGGLRCTTVARTLVDLAARRECRNLPQLCEQAEFLGLLDAAAIEDLIVRMGYPHGSGRLREALGAAALGTSSAGSRLERRVLRAMLSAGLPRPRLQYRIGPMRVDFFWPQYGLVLEVDGPHHDRPLQRAKDQARDHALVQRGLVVLRIRAADFDADPHAELARVAAAMRLSGAVRQQLSSRCGE